jgi:hypothetical protein
MRIAVRVAFSLGLLAGSALPAVAADMAPHRAVYDLTLLEARGNVVSARGTMSYEVQDACDGWASDQRLHMDITNRDGQDVVLESTYLTWESKDGREFRFQVQQKTDTAITSEITGTAKTGPDGGEAVYTSPHDARIMLPKGTLLPMAHTEAAIAAAVAGKRFLNLPLFDGTSETGAQMTAITITDTKPAGAEGGQWDTLLRLTSTAMHIAFFGLSAESVTPEYELGLRYWANGVGDDMRMDFGNFVMHGQMKAFTVLQPHC